MRRVVAARVGRVGRVLEDRDDRGPEIRRAEVDAQCRQAARVVVVVGHRQAEVDRVVERPLVHLRQDHAPPRPARSEVDSVLVLGILVTGVEHGPIDRADIARREDVHAVVIVVQGQADLLEVVDAL